MPRKAHIPAGFTLTELLIVILIIAILIAILIPTVSAVRNSAMKADTQNLISQISGAITRYHQDFNAYPGVFHNQAIIDGSAQVAGDDAAIGEGAGGESVTMSENLVLSLLGGIKDNSGTWVFDSKLVFTAAGPTNLGTPKRYAAYLSVNQDMLSVGKMSDSDNLNPQALMQDSIIPEFLDRFSDPLPILYLRARSGASGIYSNNGNYQYDVRQIEPYLRDTPKDGLKEVGPFGDPSDQGNDYGSAKKPFGGYHYFRHPTLGGDNATGTPRQKDGYVLISAGPDRIYGTRDDITSWGSQ